MRETEKVPTRNEASYPVGVKHVATTCATPPEDINAEQSPKRLKKKKKKEEKGRTHIYKISSHIQPKYVHPCESKQNSSYSCARLRYGRPHE